MGTDGSKLAGDERKIESAGSTLHIFRKSRTLGTTQAWGTRTIEGSPVVPEVNITYAI